MNISIMGGGDVGHGGKFGTGWDAVMTMRTRSKSPLPPGEALRQALRRVRVSPAAPSATTCARRDALTLTLSHGERE
jgi:hypothetical protein